MPFDQAQDRNSTSLTTNVIPAHAGIQAFFLAFEERDDPPLPWTMALLF